MVRSLELNLNWQKQHPCSIGQERMMTSLFFENALLDRVTDVPFL